MLETTPDLPESAAIAQLVLALSDESKSHGAVLLEYLAAPQRVSLVVGIPDRDALVKLTLESWEPFF
jgi:hypothetical protein